MSLLLASDDNASVTMNENTGAVHLDTQGGSAALHLSIASQFVAAGEGGSIDLEIDNGVVTESSATGRFAGKLLPSLNSPISSWDSLTLTASDLSFDLALDSSLTPDADSIAIDDIQAGLDYTEPVPEPSSLCLFALAACAFLPARRRLKATNPPRQ
jgi:hypothetical protein